MRVLVTGSSGLIGGHTLQALKARHRAVRSLDKTEGGDIRNEGAVRKAVRGVDAVIHLGAISSVHYSIKHPAETADINITGTINLLEACRRYDVKKLVFASSAAVYGEPEELPVREDHPLRPINPYGVTKLTGERYVSLYGDTYGLKTVCLRYFNVYGVGQTRGLVAEAINAAGRRRPFIIFGDGRQTRDFVNVTDVVRSTLLALDKNVNGVFNIGSGAETSVREVLRSLQELTGNHSIRYEPKRIGEIRRIYADISRAKRVLKYRPKVSLIEGLREVVKQR